MNIHKHAGMTFHARVSLVNPIRAQGRQVPVRRGRGHLVPHRLKVARPLSGGRRRVRRQRRR